MLRMMLCNDEQHELRSLARNRRRKHRSRVSRGLQSDLFHNSEVGKIRSLTTRANFPCLGWKLRVLRDFSNKIFVLY